MAKAKLVCSDCGNELSIDDRFCSKCGAKVEHKDVSPQPLVMPRVAAVPCEVCGHENLHAGSYCEACGSSLPGRIIVEQTADSTDGNRKPVPLRKIRPAKNQSSSFKFETWHYVVAVMILGLLGYFVYLELQRNYSAGTVPQQSSAPMQFPSSQAASTPPTKEILDAIDRLQKTARDNPNDVGAKLLLANALHDGAMHDGSLFPRAIDAYKIYLKEKPGDPNARVDLGICYFELGKIDSTKSAQLFTMAIGEMETAVKNTPSHQAGAFNLGIVHLYSGNMQESNKWMKKTIDLNPKSDLGKRAKAILEQHNQAG